MKAIGKTLALAVVLALFTIRAAVATTPAPAPAPATVEDQPHMQMALDALRQARHHLEEAIPDKGGHRNAAIKACDDAIKHTEEGIKYANEHHDHDHDNDRH
jgi:hypothetical protein